MRLAKLRTLDEFAGKPARFQLPDVQKQERWGNRVAQNLLYYQTNYFAASALIFLAFLVADPAGLLCGCAVTVACVGLGFALAGRHRAELRAACERHPVIACVLALACATLLVYCLRAALTCLLAVLLPALLCLLHASLRLRNVSSKVSNRLRNLRPPEEATPMELLLACLTVVEFEAMDL